MQRSLLPTFAIYTALLLGAPPASACGEGLFNTGKGLPNQAYLAPRQAAVLVYSDGHINDSNAKQESVYAGLQKAGHTVTVVRDSASLRQAMREHRYDVVIAALDGVTDVIDSERAEGNAEEGGGARTALLPIVARAQRNSKEVRNRFNLFLLDGSSLGQYLKAINLLVAPQKN